MTRHKHADLMIAYANDTSLVVEVCEGGDWCETSQPLWRTDLRYRIKPEPKKVYVYAYKYLDRWHSCSSADLKDLTSTRNKDLLDGTDVTNIKEVELE